MAYILINRVMQITQANRRFDVRRFKPYPAYKDSGAEWLGEIPGHWDVKRFGFNATFIVPMRDKPEDLTGDIPWIRIEDFDGKRISASKSGQGVHTETVREMNLKVFPVGTVLCSCSCNMGATAIVAKPLVSNQTFIGIVPGQRFTSEYLYYLLQVAREHLTALATGAIQQYLSRNHFSCLRIPFLPNEEQRAIAAFLDRETARIDELVAKKERLIELLQEKRTALITSAVTKGLDPTVRMKDSRIEWLGEIPAHWEVKRLRHVGEPIIGLTYEPDDVVGPDEGILVLRASNVSNGHIDLADNVHVRTSIPEHLITRIGDILICARSGSRDLIGKNAMIYESTVGLTFGTFMIVFRSPYNPFLFYVFNSALFEYQSGTFLTSTINQLTVGNLKDMTIPIAPDSEQVSIAGFLDRETARIDTLIAKVREAIVRLKEYRTTLISAAVTGKIDVRGEAA